MQKRPMTGSITIIWKVAGCVSTGTLDWARSRRCTVTLVGEGLLSAMARQGDTPAIVAVLQEGAHPLLEVVVRHLRVQPGDARPRHVGVLLGGRQVHVVGKRHLEGEGLHPQRTGHPLLGLVHIHLVADHPLPARGSLLHPVVVVPIRLVREALALKVQKSGRDPGAPSRAHRARVMINAQGWTNKCEKLPNVRSSHWPQVSFTVCPF